MKSRELDLLHKFSGIEYVAEPGKCIVEVLHLWTFEHKFTFASILFDVLVQLDHRDVLGQVANEDGLHGLVLLSSWGHLLCLQILD